MKTKKDQLQDFFLMLTGALFVSLIIISLESIEFSVSRLFLYSISGCIVGYWIRKVVLHNTKNNKKCNKEKK